MEPEKFETAKPASLKASSPKDGSVPPTAPTEPSLLKLFEELMYARLQAEENEQKFRAIFENAQDGILLVDCQTQRLLMPNRQMCRLLGCSAEEIETMTLSDILPAEVSEQSLRYFNYPAEDRPQQIPCHPIRCKDGKVFYADISTAQFLINGVSYAMGIFRDATERKRLLDEDARQQGELDAVFQAVPVGICHLKNRVFIRVNKIFCDYLGYQPEELIGRAISCLYPTQEDFEYWGKSLYSRLQSQGEVTEELTFRHKDGRPIDVLLRGAYLNPLERDKGELFALTDITDRKRVEQELQFTQFAVDHLTTPMFWLNSAEQFIKVNEAACRLLGYTAEELLRMNVSDIDCGWAAQEAAQNQRVGQRPFETRYKAKDGRIFPVEITVSPLRYKEQDYHCVFAHDISERKAYESAREKLLRELRTKNEELESIVFVASHDLRGPLVNIEGFAGELQRAIEEIKALLEHSKPSAESMEILRQILENDIRESLHFISAGTAKMDSLLSGLLQLSRLGTAPLRFEPIRMNLLLQMVLGAMRYEIRRLHAEVAVEDLPDCMGDAIQINQVFSNLIDNALKYQRAEEPLRIRISGHIDKNEVIYSVQDNGIGIAPEHYDKIFEIFHRLNPDGPQKGEGLGLTIVRRILDRLEGRIWVESELGRGSTFFVALPSVR